ncbi:MAG: DEAD/DEAH box helicase [Actinomycetia bacterium]|jgi:superfamily II DNA/RNA helicase|nr:DEAD/DEAH box helicase [Actinomycetes bacterium]
MATSPLDLTAAPSFGALGVPQHLVAALAAQGIDRAFPIQTATLPDSLGGRDVLGRGRTGSGKTIAFGLPLVARLAADPRPTRAMRPRGLVLVPTRELATQVHTVLAPLAASAGMTTTTIFGGVGQHAQVTALSRAVDIVVACPGRLEDLMRQRKVLLDDVRVSVLDEADHMADLGFLPGVRRILDHTPRTAQRLLFSATLDNGVDVLVRRYLTDPVTHSVDDDVTTEPDMAHHVLTVTAADKPGVVHELAAGEGRSLLFLRTKRGARKLARDLTQAGLPAVDLHGNLAQNARDRNLEAFRSGRVRVLVATDIAARGIHVDDIALVVHVDPPAEHKAYLHRSGRTARAGSSGVVVTLQTDAQRADVAAMTRRAGIRATTARVRPGSPELRALSGPARSTPSHPTRAEPAPRTSSAAFSTAFPRRRSR